ncbi:glycosyltransferase [Enterobacter hormaechei]|uniref:glycosyltransferase n=1 Tax=Enterobacter hormaechei TaxID=158836 RepID=UPI00292B0793|nr:glycosyltransferase [Enterobacter hormaechei]ELS4524382.1 glycosyltransferase [Enterobacter hormaechei]MDV1203241.1 glycosyltransferase [Enterobacter hormaechei]MDV1244589.1 glycosyltransferase [Enterobacter hormaechei]MDV1270732.1 glycosyltransferase [Enterobacter hormaechei]MDV1279839.1 glycosyltransferase [Enterobacter hormaechei]
MFNKNRKHTSKVICFFVVDLFERGGLQRVTLYIAERLAQWYHVHIITFGDEKFRSIPYQYEKDKIKIHFVERKHQKNKIISRFEEVRKINKIISENNIDTIISAGMGSISWTFLPQLINRCKYICWDHTSFLRKERWAIRGRLLSKIFADNIIALTLKDSKMWKAKKVICIYNPSPFADKHSRVNFSERKNVVIAIGRFVEVKGFERILTIWKNIENNQELPFILKIYGEGPLEPQLRSKILKEDIKNVEILPYRKDIESVYAEAKIQIMGSYYEGLPMVLIEGQCCGVPAISYDIPSGPSEILEDDKTGYLIADNDQTKFTHMLSELMKSSATNERLSECSYQNSKKFSINKIIKDWKSLLG